MRTAIKKLTIFISFMPFSISKAATVSNIKAEKSIVEVTPDADETLEKGQKVCFFDSTQKKVGCGKVAGRKGESRVFVKVKNPKALKKIEPGMTTTASGAKSGEKTGKSGGNSKNRPPFRIWFDYGISLATPAVFNKIVYNPPQSNEQVPTTLWEKEKAESKAQGFNLQVGIPLGKFSLNPGIRLRPYTQSVVDTDYLRNSPNPYVTTSQSASALGIFTDFGFLYSRLSSFMALNASAGLDIDRSSVEVNAKKKTDDPVNSPVAGNDTIIAAKSSLMVISLRVGGSIEFVKFFGGRLALNILLPLSASGSVSGGFNEDEKRGLADADGDFKTALGHKKNGLAYEAALGLMLEF